MLKSFDQISEYKLQQITIAEAASAASADPSTFVDMSVYDRSPRLAVLWVNRGLLVGMRLGAAYGSVFPLFGTAIGAALGVGAGFVLGVGIAIIVFSIRFGTRRRKVSQGLTTVIEQGVACLTILIATLIVSRRIQPDDRILAFYVPATLGIAHSLLAKPPMPGYVYAGLVTGTRRKVVRGLPVAILACALAAFCLVYVLANR